MNHDVFISYSSKEKSIADGVCHYLEDNGVKCWMAPRDIPVGFDYAALINDAIKSSRAVVLVFSKFSSDSRWVYSEINIAFSAGKPIVPFRIDETILEGGMELMLNQMHWIDAFPSYADRLPDLLRSVCGFIGREVSEPQRTVAVVEEEPRDATESEEHFLKVRCTLDCRLFIDCDECATINAGSITKIPLHQGEYLVQVTSLDGLDTMEQELDMPAADKLLFFDLLALQKKRLAVEQAERKRREEAVRKIREEAERKKKEEAERIAREEAARKARRETEQREALEEAARRAREESMRKAREEAECKAREEAEQKAREEAARRNRELYSRVNNSNTSHLSTNEDYVEKKWYIKARNLLIVSAIFGLIVAATCQWKWGKDGFMGGFTFVIAVFWPFCLKWVKVGMYVWLINIVLLIIICFVFHLW